MNNAAEAWSHFSRPQAVGFSLPGFTPLAAFRYWFLIYCTEPIRKAGVESIGPLPAGHPGRRIDRIISLASGGAIALSEKQWLSVADTDAKNRPSGETVVSNHI